MNIIGHENQRRYLSSLLKNGFLGHAYLFSGPSMIGKLMCAEEFYKKANSKEEISENDPYLLKISSNSEDKNKNSISIETIRSIRSFLSLKPGDDYKKFVIINDADKMTGESSNALLKILEEPPSYAVIILISNMPGSLPKTIRSRCEQINFSVLPATFMAGLPVLKKINETEKSFVLKLASGRPGYLNNLVEDKKFKEAEKSIGDLRKLLTQGTVERFKYAQSLSEGDNLKQTVTWWIDWVSASLRSSIKSAPILRQLLNLNEIISQPQFNSRLALENFFLQV